MSRRSRLLLVSGIAMAVFALDQTSKHVARDTLQFAHPISVAGGMVQLVYTENSGGMLGFGAALAPPLRFFLLTVLTAIFIVALTLYILLNRSLSGFQIGSLSSALGGGASNYFDRVANEGRVIDFLILGGGEFRTAIFNVADLFITVGIALFLLTSLRSQ